MCSFCGLACRHSLVHETSTSCARFVEALSAASLLWAQRPATGTCTRMMPIAPFHLLVPSLRARSRNEHLVCLFCGSARSDCIAHALSRSCPRSSSHSTCMGHHEMSTQGAHFVAPHTCAMVWTQATGVCPHALSSWALPLMPGVPHPFMHTHALTRTLSHTHTPPHARPAQGATKRAYGVLISCRQVSWMPTTECRGH